MKLINYLKDLFIFFHTTKNNQWDIKIQGRENIQIIEI